MQQKQFHFPCDDISTRDDTEDTFKSFGSTSRRDKEHAISLYLKTLTNFEEKNWTHNY